MKSAEEIKKAITDYTHMTDEDFIAMYRLRSTYETHGFIRALRWVLELP